jgi:hypothetical protein
MPLRLITVASPVVELLVTAPSGSSDSSQKEKLRPLPAASTPKPEERAIGS